MKPIIVGILVFGLAACGNTTSNEPTASPNAANQTTTTGAVSPARKSTHDTQRFGATGDLPGAGEANAAAGGGGETVHTTPPLLLKPGAPAPLNTGDPPNARR